MSIKRSKKLKEVVAIFVADIHLQHKAPILRSKEKDWYSAMARPLRELRALCKRNKKAKLFCAGDVFTYWKAPPELINFALDELPDMYAIAGQHDLPNHDPAQINKSAYATLVGAGKIKDPWSGDKGADCLRVEEFSIPCNDGFYTELNIVGIPYGDKLFAIKKTSKRQKFIALQHKYLWVPGSPDALRPNETDGTDIDAASNWDVLVYGDNHQPWSRTATKQKIINCGTMIVRLKPEIKNPTRATLLYDDGEIGFYEFDTRDDIYWQDYPDEIEVLSDHPEKLKELTDRLQNIGSADLDVRETILASLTQSDLMKSARRMIIATLEELCNG